MSLATINNKEIKEFKKTSFEKNCFHRNHFLEIKSNNYLEPLKFHRVDFRGSTFNNCFFQDADFFRSDFISCDFSKTEFVHCSFKTTSIMNSNFSNCDFSRNISMTPDVIRCNFHKTNFINQKFYRSVWRESSFKECTFEKFKIERSTIEEISFEGCTINDLNLSRLIAQDLTFKKTTFKNVVFDIDYIGTYLFDKDSLNNISFMYKDEIIELSLDNAEKVKELTKYYFKNDRFSDAFGISMIYSSLTGEKENNFIDFWILCLNKSLELSNSKDLQQHLNRLIKMYLFYLDEKLFTISDSIKVLKEISSLLPKIDTPIVYEKIYYLEAMIKRTIEENLYSLNDIIDDKKLESPVIARLTFQTDLESEALKSIEYFMSMFTTKEKNQYKIIKIIYGSIWVDIITSLSVLLLIAKTAKYLSKELFSIVLTYKNDRNKLLVTKQATEYILGDNKVNKTELLEKTQLVSKIDQLVTKNEKNNEMKNLVSMLKEMNINVSDEIQKVS